MVFYSLKTEGLRLAINTQRPLKENQVNKATWRQSVIESLNQLVFEVIAMVLEQWIYDQKKKKKKLQRTRYIVTINYAL